jgi:hypothetical protein
MVALDDKAVAFPWGGGFLTLGSNAVVMECHKEQNLQNCNCSYNPCSRKGICCECIPYHFRMGELPACVFPDDAERTYDRSIGHFVRLYQQGRI